MNPHHAPRTFVALLSLAMGLGSHAQINDPAFSIGTGASNRVTCSALQLDGDVMIGGNFTSYNGTAISRVARINIDGSLDGGFAPSSGANLQVNALALASGGDTYIGGQFTTFNGTGRNRIARVNSDGTLDAGFAPGTGFNNTVTGIAVQGDGKVICVGDFTSFNGTGRNRVARLNDDGTLDTGFNPGTGANFLVTSVALQSDGDILIGGFFNNYNGTTVVALARLNSDGSLDTAHNFGGSGLNNAVYCIALQSDGKALIGGDFTTYNGTGRNRIARLNTDGTLDSGFSPGTGANNLVQAITIQSDDAVVIGGDFTTFNGSTHNRLARMSQTGSEDTGWTSGAGSTVHTLTWMPEGRIVVGGLFTGLAGGSRNRLGRLVALCTDDVDMIVVTDGAASEIEWQLIPVGYNYAAYTGNGFPNNATVSIGACLAKGCYALRVTDSGGNGITDGGYVLKSQSGDRIIDNTGNFSSGGLSQISGAQGGPATFCVSIGGHKPIYVSRDKLDWVSGQYLVSQEDAAVSQVWTDYGSGSPERASTGYDFWFFDPNGNYSFVRSRRHSTSDNFAPANAVRACHMKINNWAAANHLQSDVLYNVRVRPVLLGVAGDWGPAYRFMIDPARAACPLTKLMDIPSNPNLSCGQNREWGTGNYVHARPVTGANKYQFRFQIPAESFSVTRTSNNYFVQLNWGTNPLEVGKTYEVDVRASFDNGATWCSDIPSPMDPWGDVCLLTIVSSFNAVAPGPDVKESMPGQPGFSIWPSPSTDGVMILSIHGMEEGVEWVDLDLLDVTGRLVHQARLPMNDGFWNGAVPLPGDLPAGMYTVNARVGADRFTERWVLQR